MSEGELSPGPAHTPDSFTDSLVVVSYWYSLPLPCTDQYAEYRYYNITASFSSMDDSPLLLYTL